MSAPFSLPFESPIQELETKLAELESFSQEQDIDVSHEIENMKQKIEQTRNDIYTNLTAWQKVQVARHPSRPYTMDYINIMCTDFVEIHGDRIHRDDRAIIGGFAKIDGQKVMIIGSQKGRDTKSNVETNFGCAHPEGYRKALRLMKLADKFNVPIVTLIDTKGAYAGLESEERHIAEAIAVNLRECFNLKVPIICVIIGEGGSGGALGIGIGNRILIMEHAYYSVISPEGCAAILWKDRAYSDKAAEALKITGKHLMELKLADSIIPEPQGGAHTDHEAAAENLKKALLENLEQLKAMTPEEIMEDRYNKFRAMGEFEGQVA
ncbi:acetyl-CoA carboxylase carboxyltransferase subunit alpha [Pontiella agarivorans]|uniref:Acetyl-coenzyme A carboxylase carboxyl transferase subunit alpha n=1 Tax=Pontiella agarivorans TaxID=3038953 RepID=A0ABU5N114_9BACT|nr:acetyl-CoA carboxylase carboxyltransferase subunit alpha [Pontiella agarivorans]MDZ8120093.1 acetyl-CoA carboxylase carboxyltransferase subunit alpha [Pontiella agarivorans]